MYVEDIFAIGTLTGLRSRLGSSKGRRLRNALLREFWKVCRYANAREWNRAVRLCEALAIVGWGSCEPVEACCGEDWTAFRNRFDENRYLSADWSKRKGGITIRPSSAMYYASPDRSGDTGDIATTPCVLNVKLASQRNWIPKNPIRLYQWLDSADATTRKLVDSVQERLYPALERDMNPHAYGTAIDRLWIDFCLSTRLRGCPETFVVIDDDARLSPAALHKRLLTMYPAAQIKRENLFLRNRYDYGSFQADKGVMKVTLHFPREFNALSLPAQKREFAERLSTAVSGAVERLAGRDLDFDFLAMQRDFEAILARWRKS